MDIVAVAKDLPGKGEYVYGSELHFVPGGNGLNTAVAAARLGTNVKFVGFLGNDDLGKRLSGFLKKENVDTTQVQILGNAQSGVVLSSLSSKEERHIVFPGSNLSASADMLPNFDISPSDIVLSQLTINQDIIRRAFEKAKKAGAKTVLNLFPNYELVDGLIGLSDYVILNEVELAFRTGDTDFANARHKDLHMDYQTIGKRVRQIRASDGQTIIVTLAERGLIAIKGDGQTIVNGIKVKLVDATGAGDCFMGAFAIGLS
ncbi:MAG: hypothetical protein KGH64_03995, partial [Candidatus Micrarchaeota archaeon]|nr:hypothetical protein [Candidatus Micrarchaeota archaeon]